MRLQRIVSVAACLLLLFAVISCQADSASQKPRIKQSEKESNMMIYPMLFADYQHNSFIKQTTNARGEQAWFSPNSDTIHKSPPTAILLTEQGLTVQYNDRFEQMTFDGKILWEEGRDPGLDIFVHDNGIYYRNSGRRLTAVDFKKNRLFEGRHVTTSSRRGFFYLVLPLGDQRYLVQTFNRAPEPEPDIPPEEDNYNLVMIDPSGEGWLHEFEGEALPGLVTGDGQRVVIVNDNGEVTSFDPVSGDIIYSFTLEGTRFLQASLDGDNNLLIVMVSSSSEQVLANYTLNGNSNWEISFPDDGFHPFRQPPAVDSSNRVYYITNNVINVIDKGKSAWFYPAPAAEFYQYITALGDNSILVSASGTLIHLDTDGNVLFTVELESGDVFTTPPVVDKNGLIYVGGKAGIYCFK